MYILATSFILFATFTVLMLNSWSIPWFDLFYLFRLTGAYNFASTQPPRTATVSLGLWGFCSPASCAKYVSNSVVFLSGASTDSYSVRVPTRALKVAGILLFFPVGFTILAASILLGIALQSVDRPPPSTALLPPLVVTALASLTATASVGVQASVVSHVCDQGRKGKGALKCMGGYKGFAITVSATFVLWCLTLYQVIAWRRCKKSELSEGEKLEEDSNTINKWIRQNDRPMSGWIRIVRPNIEPTEKSSTTTTTTTKTSTTSPVESSPSSLLQKDYQNGNYI